MATQRESQEREARVAEARRQTATTVAELGATCDQVPYGQLRALVDTEEYSLRDLFSSRTAKANKEKRMGKRMQELQIAFARARAAVLAEAFHRRHARSQRRAEEDSSEAERRKKKNEQRAERRSRQRRKRREDREREERASLESES